MQDFVNCKCSQTTGWCESHGTVLFLSSVETEMTDTIEIGLKIIFKAIF